MSGKKKYFRVNWNYGWAQPKIIATLDSKPKALEDLLAEIPSSQVDKDSEVFYESQLKKMVEDKAGFYYKRIYKEVRKNGEGFYLHHVKGFKGFLKSVRTRKPRCKNVVSYHH